MKSMIFVLVLVVAGIVGLGFYMGWFHLSSNSHDSKTDITLSVDKGEIQKDKDKVVNKVQDISKPENNKSAATTQENQN